MGQMVGQGRDSPDPHVSFLPSPRVNASPLVYKRGRRTLRRDIHIRTCIREDSNTRACAVGTLVPLSLVCNPYCKLEYKSTRARTEHRDILPEPV